VCRIRSHKIIIRFWL